MSEEELKKKKEEVLLRIFNALSKKEQMNRTAPQKN
jgi:hypothetical protein